MKRMDLRVLPPDEAKRRARANLAEWQKLGKEGIDRLLGRMERFRKGELDLDEGHSILDETLRVPSYMRLQEELVKAIDRHDFDGMVSSLQRGAHANGYFLGKTPIMHACEKGSKRIIMHLLEQGADPNARPIGFEMDGALFRAGGKGVDILQLLIDSGADVDFPHNGQGWSILMAACATGRVHEARFLLDNGADIEMRSYIDQTALIVASERGKSESVFLLLSRGADVNAVSKYGRSALMEACSGGDFPVTAQLLIGAGADIHLKDVEGDTALDIAIEKKHESIAGVLRHHGAKDQG